jgi:hypothetical protein
LLGLRILTDIAQSQKESCASSGRDGRELRLTVIGTEGVDLGQLALGNTHDPLSEDSVSNSFNRLTDT